MKNDILTGKTISEQMEYFKVVQRKETRSISTDILHKSFEDKIPLSTYVKVYEKELIVEKERIVGFVYSSDIQIYVGEEFAKIGSFNYIDHSWDHYAAMEEGSYLKLVFVPEKFGAIG